jgi:uncharacterized protein (DUF1499 family)
MRLPSLGLILLLLAGCTVPPHTPTAPSEAEFRAMLALGNGSNIAVTSDSASESRLRTRLAPVSVAEMRTAALRTVANMPRWKVADSTGTVLWITRTTRLFRFVDDLYVLIEPRGDGSAVLIRSASRIGESDLGQNRRNIAEFWTALGQSQAISPAAEPPLQQSPR